MKTNGIVLMAFASIFFLACETGSESPQDLEAPVIDHAESHDEIEPQNGEVFGETADHAPIRFSVEDPSGIGQVRVNVHANFDGHSHARMNNDFVRLNINDIYSPEASNPDFRFPEGSTRINIDDPGTDIFWAGANSRLTGPVIAGSYDVGIEATDIHGNQTGYDDGSSYLATIQIRTPYAPSISITNLHEEELEAEAGMPLNVQGSISRTSHDLSAPISFLWIRLTEEHDDLEGEGGHNHRISEEDYYDQMWGSSAWLEEGSGPELPHDEMLDLSKILTGDNAIQVPSGEDHLDLVIRAEDVNGNTTEKTFTVHIE
ncbi:DUF4625 domain-containing protein [Cyclobacterium jeungdonense]|uniref:DUF4625 domain-containing protein n=1 Tax=Cyclobacterium jeungdonense TaxID=708087 RepID=A0ABT8CE49_9BACT|nr:DUF4625 domain-containing protein [Cyclobacterium jeungdonense]MDN3690342.1 DUF4625 domain-containing protein [Cyclobacterium jeungdonense]